MLAARRQPWKGKAGGYLELINQVLVISVVEIALKLADDVKVLVVRFSAIGCHVKPEGDTRPCLSEATGGGQQSKRSVLVTGAYPRERVPDHVGVDIETTQLEAFDGRVCVRDLEKRQHGPRMARTNTRTR